MIITVANIKNHSFTMKEFSSARGAIFDAREIMC